jgi:ribonuclease HII
MRVGFDEVGRGALAGPVVVSLVASPENWPLKIHSKATASEKKFYEKKDVLLAKVNDSKKVRPHTRKKISDFVKEYDFPHVILSGSNELIDSFGIGKVLTHLLGIGLEIISSKLKTNSVIKVYIDGRIKLIKLDPILVSKLLQENNLDASIDYTILVQQMKTDMLSGFEKFSLIREDRADAMYLPVALASNVAKVYRDELMIELSSQYPNFGWEHNVGYGTKTHREAIVQNPTNPWLRKTWLKNILATVPKE